MKITRVRTKLYRWKGPVKTDDTVFATPLSALPFQSDAQAPFRFFSWLVVEVETDDGRVGHRQRGAVPGRHEANRRREAGAAAWSARIRSIPSTCSRRCTARRSRLAARGRCWRRSARSTSRCGTSRARSAGSRCSCCLGGRTKPAIPAYYSRLYTRNLDRLQEEAAACKEQGFRGMKLRCGYPLTEGLAGLEKNVEMVRLTREAVGDDVDVMVECYMGFDFAYARRLLKRIEPYNPRWVEELLLPDEIHNFAKLRRYTDIPLSGGEHEFTRYGFHDLLQAGALDIFQFDTNRVGGFTEARKICRDGAGVTASR